MIEADSPTGTVDGASASSKDILTVTLSPALDISADAAVIRPDHKIHCGEAGLSPGGGGINVARAVIHLGGRATALFPFGGTTGQMVVELLEADAVPIVALPILGLTREAFSVRETTTGHEYRFVLPGPTLTVAELDALAAAVLSRAGPASLVVFSGSLPTGVDPAGWHAMIHAVSAAGSTVIADSSGSGLDAAARAGADVLKPSLAELERHDGQALRTTNSIIGAADRLLDSGPNGAVLVSLGPAGALLVRVGAEPVAIRAPKIEFRSAIGAGDSLVAALALGLATGHDLVSAARWGVAAGTAATMAPGHTLCQATETAMLLPRVHAARPRRATAARGRA